MLATVHTGNWLEYDLVLALVGFFKPQPIFMFVFTEVSSLHRGKIN